jgi:hypothetical protein
VGIFDKLGLDKEIAGATDRRPVPPVGRHQAQQWMFSDTCVVTMAVGPSSSVDAAVIDSDHNDQRSCEIAMKLARLVEPKLP